MYIGDNSKLFLEPTELMRRIKDREKPCGELCARLSQCKRVYCAARKVS